MISRERIQKHEGEPSNFSIEDKNRKARGRPSKRNAPNTMDSNRRFKGNYQC